MGFVLAGGLPGVFALVFLAAVARLAGAALGLAERGVLSVLVIMVSVDHRGIAVQDQ
jgi:hypothetical protein